MWGEFEDKVDELTMTMVANQVEFNEINGNSFFDHSQGKVGMLLAGAQSNLAADRQDVKEKQVVKKELYQWLKLLKARLRSLKKKTFSR